MIINQVEAHRFFNIHHDRLALAVHRFLQIRRYRQCVFAAIGKRNRDPLVTMSFVFIHAADNRHQGLRDFITLVFVLLLDLLLEYFSQRIRP